MQLLQKDWQVFLFSFLFLKEQIKGIIIIFQGHYESECWHKKKDEAEAELLAIKERSECAVKGRHTTKSDKP